MKLFRKTLSLVLCLVMLLCVFAGCGGEQTGGESSSEVTSSTNQVGNIVGLGGGSAGAKFAMTSPSGTYTYANTIDVSWNGLKDGETVSLKVEKKNGSKYTTVLEKTGLTGSSFKSNDKLENGVVYRFTLKAVGKDGTERVATNTTNGLECTILNLAKNPTVNAGMDFAFNGSISEKVLNNYLARAISYSVTSDNITDAARAILNTGTKYVCRTIGEWYPSAAFELTTLPKYTEWMKTVHSYDPDIIFEAAIFETCGPGMDKIKVPDWVFKAFGQKVENRNFNHKEMLYPDGSTAGSWDGKNGVPDITQLETQMFFYYRACLYINAGCEALHLGQTGLMGKSDPNRAAWTKVIHLIRDYAKSNARRKYVIINCHYGSHKFLGTDGVMLADFNMYPLRLKPYRVAGEPAMPQKCKLNMEVDAPYKKGISGKSPSGWSTTKYPYLVEFDNYGKPAPETPTDVWGMDEISWIATQPDDYRHSFFTEVRKMVSDLNENGHVALPGSRTVACSDDFNWYNMNNSKYCRDGFSDEEAIIAAFKAYK